ncbi:hypothetical protein PhCBS80983_g04165 [Powellomyces hirtus]|uniref:Zinc finger C2H2 LYAR-type domain-containing protein n=1 Tax=Powellomyces hirtus TaxID=109895 RepID=A0A507DZQ7_9FUNG|nr:hypothetical protein PhCBS80983_g04165 [Powellomyces hirtus]
MVSFVCESCQETLKKAKLDQHTYRCHYAQFSCIDCSVTFQGTDYRAHTSCISEAEKYQGALYKGPKKNGTNNAKNGNAQQQQQQAKLVAAAENIAKPLPTESLIDQIKKAEAATGTGDKRAREEEKELEAGVATETKKTKKSKKGKDASEKIIVAIKEVTVSADIPSAINKVLKKNPEVTLAELRSKVVKRLTKGSADTTEQAIFEAFDENVKIVFADGVASLKF